MYNQAPENYICPICPALNGIEGEMTMIKQADIVYRDDLVTALIGSKFVKSSPGHPIVVPNKHFENFFELPDAVAKHIMVVAKKLSLAVKEVRECDGIKIVQNNGSAAGQHAFHYHLHIFPVFSEQRFSDDKEQVFVSLPEERIPYATALREHLEEEKDLKMA